ncbi:hypothetical protein A6F68_01259 [Tsuneonella dongtanensis]|uniref:Lipoprotein n=1 Tax=Tsuneonella dongtanensis TaxID=692370 RepID=A0A1B2AC97_9SPHN|nr:hypothetical protein [Tsuneonella dongtanensis]ANY19776.1 hypothetical protein A6F68_01259 [Tsuneonella dongtanensis]
MRPLIPVFALPLLAACADRAETPAPSASAGTATAASVADTAPSAEPYPPDLAWMLARAKFAEEPGVPCLYREMRAPWVNDPAERTRVREVRSDSYWLGRWARENLGDRLAYAEVTYDMGDEPITAFPDTPPRLIYEIAVTGSEPVKAPPLGGRAKNVPVVVRYDRPVSFDEFMERREEGHAARGRFLDSIGEGGSPGGSWAVTIDVFHEGGTPDPEALAQCDALRRAYRLPVLMRFVNARITNDMGQP